MNSFESYSTSLYDEYEQLLEQSAGKPYALMSTDGGDILVQTGIVGDIDFENGTFRVEHVNGTERSIVVDIPVQDIVLTGMGAIRTHLESMLTNYVETDNLQSAVVALTLQDRFSDELGKPSEEACGEIAQRILDEPIGDFEFLPACLLDAPEQLRIQVLQEIARRIQSTRSLAELVRDRTVMRFVTAYAELENISEMQAARHISDAYSGQPR